MRTIKIVGRNRIFSPLYLIKTVLTAGFTRFYQALFILKKFINNSRGKYKRNECLINVCKSDKDLS